MNGKIEIFGKKNRRHKEETVEVLQQIGNKQDKKIPGGKEGAEWQDEDEREE